MFHAQLRRQVGRHQGIFEKTPGIAEHSRIGQLFAANAADGPTDITGGRLANPLLGQPLTQRTVIQTQSAGASQGETHTQNQPATRFTLEPAVTVSKLTLVQRELTQLTGVPIQGGQPGKHIFDFNPISANVLHRRRAHRTGNQTEILQPLQALLQGPLHKGMPGLPRFGFHQHRITLARHNPQTATGHAQHQRLNITRQQQVAATANHQQRQLQALGRLERLAHLGIVMGVGQVTRTRRHAEGIERLQRNIGFYIQTHRRPRTSASKQAAACSARSRTCSKPSSPP